MRLERMQSLVWFNVLKRTSKEEVVPPNHRQVSSMLNAATALFWVWTSSDQLNAGVSSSLVDAVSQPPAASSAVLTK